MKKLNNQHTFNNLNQTKHRLVKDGQYSIFPESKPDTEKQNTEYWFFSDIYNTYNDETTPTYNLDMNKIVEKNLVKPEKRTAKSIKLIPCNTHFFNDHVQTIKHAYKLGYHEYKKANDLQLTRYACWCLIKNIPDNAFSYTYFMSPAIKENITFAELEKISYQFARPYARDKITKINSMLNGLTNALNSNIKTLNYNKILSFFNNYDSAALKIRHNITDIHTSIFDFMGTHSLNYMCNGIQNTFSNIGNAHKNINKFAEELHKQLIIARQEMINATGIYPENDIYKTTIDKVKQELKQTEIEFIKNYANIKLH